MSEEIENNSGWQLSEEDREALSRLHAAIWGLAALARSGSDLIAVGEACDAIEKLVEDEEVEVNVGLSIGFRRGDRNFEEGLFVCFRINEEEVRLDELNTSYSSDVGSDHFTRDYTRLLPEGGFDSYAVGEWLEIFNEVRAQQDVKLSCERDHV